MIKIELEEWQVKNLREYFRHNDKTQTEHWAYDVFNKAYKEQCNITDVVGQSEQLCFCESDRKLFTASVYCPKHDKMIEPE